MLWRPVAPDEPDDSPDDGRAVGFWFWGFIGAAGGEALGVCGFIAVRWPGAVGGVSAQFAADGCLVHSEDAGDGCLRVPGAAQGLYLIPLFAGEVTVGF